MWRMVTGPHSLVHGSWGLVGRVGPGAQIELGGGLALPTLELLFKGSSAQEELHQSTAATAATACSTAARVRHRTEDSRSMLRGGSPLKRPGPGTAALLRMFLNGPDVLNNFFTQFTLSFLGGVHGEQERGAQTDPKTMTFSRDEVTDSRPRRHVTPPRATASPGPVVPLGPVRSPGPWVS